LSFIYLLALAGVGLALIAVTVDSVLSVARKPRWSEVEGMARPQLAVVETTDRRELELPFVGRERRSAGEAAQHEAVSPRRAA